MKKMLILLLSFTCTKAFTQNRLDSFNYSRNHITLRGLNVLADWGGINIGSGIAGWAGSKQNNAGKYFYQMNTFWGAINFGAGLSGIISAKRKQDKQLSTTENVQAQHKIENTFLINAGLDVAYIGTGIYLNNRGSNRDNSKLQGYGSSVIVQGIFLLLFDGTMYTLQRTNGNTFRRLLNKNSISFSGNRVGIVHTL